MESVFFNPGKALPFEANHVRLVLRVYFIAGFGVINFVAHKALRATARLQFISNKRIGVAHLTGWLSGSDIFTTAWTMKRSSGGRAAMTLMVFAFAINKAVDLSITGLVVPGVPLQTSCFFQAPGLITSTEGPYVDGRPPQSWQSFDASWNAQRTSIINGGKKGIYKKFDNNAFFSATDADILTTWDCTPTLPDQMFPGTFAPINVIRGLTANGFLYGNQISNSTSAPSEWFDSNASYDSLVVWTSSVPDSAGTSFSVKAAVEVTPRPNSSEAIVMRPMSCSLEDDAAVEGIAASISSISTLIDWAPHFQGIMYNSSGSGIIANAPEVLSFYLNAMFMVQGSNNSVSGTLPLTAPLSERVVGCVEASTQVPYFIIVMVPFLFFAIIAMVLWWIITEMRIGFHREVANTLPYSAMDWMLQAMREHDMETFHDGVVKYSPTDIGKWDFVAGQNHEPAHLKHSDDNDQSFEKPLLSTEIPKGS
ncbi:MAG: hypothetical protein M1822_009636 [Bathelium mastoideum]|nr:MAG: hypothetical protein M1822_009636 [Bathelium mastoideum]